MAIVKASYTKLQKAAKASIRYIQHRPGQNNGKLTRALFGTDGVMGRTDAYRMIDEASKNSTFFRFVISPDPQLEDTKKDLYLREVSDETMRSLEERLQSPVAWVGAIHDDHTDIRHVHIVAVVSGKLNPKDFSLLRHAATAACLEQRSYLDLGAGRQIDGERRVQQHEDIGLGLALDV